MKIDVFIKAASGFEHATITSLENRLLMLHAPGISALWPLDGIGPTLTHQGNGICKLGFMAIGSESYQSFYFNSIDYDKIDQFFKKLGFPMHKPINDAEIGEVRGQGSL